MFSFVSEKNYHDFILTTRKHNTFYFQNKHNDYDFCQVNEKTQYGSFIKNIIMMIFKNTLWLFL